MRRLGLSIPRQAHAAGHSLDKAVTLPKLVELLGGQFQAGLLDQKGEPLGRNRLIGHDPYSAAWATDVTWKFFGKPALTMAPCWTTSGNAWCTNSRTAISPSMSIPVSNPIASSIKARSSVTMLPVAPGA